jgi:hypothetical protein
MWNRWTLSVSHNSVRTAGGLWIVLALAACASPGAGASVDGVFFPRLDHHADEWPAGLIQGTLFEANGCVFIKSRYVGVPSEQVLLIWPHEASLERGDTGTLQVLLEGAVVGQLGDQVELGGGFMGESRGAVGNAESLIGGEIPDRCRTEGGYFLTSGAS